MLPPATTSIEDAVNRLGEVWHCSGRRPAIQEMKTCHGLTQLAYSNQDSQLAQWHDTLPSELRWSHWAPKGDYLAPHVADLQQVCRTDLYSSFANRSSMLFHMTRISLHRSRMIEDCASPVSESAFAAARICTASVDDVTDLIRRFRTQHGLLRAPLSFALAAIAAAEAVVLIAEQDPEKCAHLGTDLADLESALGEMSETWPLASQARRRLHSNVHKLQQGPRSSVQTHQRSRSAKVNDQLFSQDETVPGYIQDDGWWREIEHSFGHQSSVEADRPSWLSISSGSVSSSSITPYSELLTPKSDLSASKGWGNYFYDGSSS